MAKKEDKNSAQLAMLQRYWNSAFNARTKRDWQWFVNDLWALGHHYAKWDRQTQQVITTPIQDGTPKVVINMILPTLRGVANYAVRNKPRAQVTPYDLTEENVKEAVKINTFLDYLHDRLSLRPKLRATMKHALKYSVGYWRIIWNESANDGLGELEVEVIDPYDLYVDPLASDISNARYAILAVRRSLSDLKDDPLYAKADWEKIGSSPKKAASTYKERIMNYDKTGTQIQSDNDSVILKEYYYKKDDKVYICAMIENEIIRKEEVTDLSRIPFFRLCADREPLQFYGDGWVKHLIPLNREYNRLASSLAEYNMVMNKGKWTSPRGSKVKVINSATGQIIEHTPGLAPTHVPIGSLAMGAIQTQMDMLERKFEEIGAMHDSSMGRVPTGVKSGRGIEALQVGDSNNMGEIVANIEIFLEETYEYMLHLAAQKYQVARNISPTSSTGQREFMKVIGEEAPNKVDGALVIPSKNVVDVQIASWLGQTPEARKEAIKELATILPDIDEQTILEAFQIGNIADVVQRIKVRREEKLQEEQARMEMETQNQMQLEQAGQPQAAGAQQANMMLQQYLQNGQLPQVPQIVDQSFVDYVSQFLSDNADLPQEDMSTLQTLLQESMQRVGR